MYHHEYECLCDFMEFMRFFNEMYGLSNFIYMKYYYLKEIVLI